MMVGDFTRSVAFGIFWGSEGGGNEQAAGFCSPVITAAMTGGGREGINGGSGPAGAQTRREDPARVLDVGVIGLREGSCFCE